ncbi:MAG TPA: hypothetical protein VFR09_08260 [Alphaproteobacteria bacterium]|nr:hypothetical protein [Alphaproteobacteria bacterium]
MAKKQPVGSALGFKFALYMKDKIEPALAALLDDLESHGLKTPRVEIQSGFKDRGSLVWVQVPLLAQDRGERNLVVTHLGELNYIRELTANGAFPKFGTTLYRSPRPYERVAKKPLQVLQS